MSNTIVIASAAILIPLNLLITFYDTRYRRIPNAFVLGTLLSGLIVNLICRGAGGLGDSLAGCLLAFGLMLAVRFFTGLGAGDVKLFGAIGSLIGMQQVLPAFLLVVLLGGLLATFAMLRAGAVRQTMIGVYQIFVGMMPGGQMPSRETFAQGGLTIPYGVAITSGSLIAVLSVLTRN